MAFDSRLQRDIMGRFATGVTVVTTRYKNGEITGMTANAVMSLSLDPPLVVVSVDKTATMHEALVDGQCYAINILARNQEHLSNQFATPGPKDFSGLDVSDGASGAPILGGTLGYLDCKLVNRLPAGDHDMFVGEVLTGQLDEGEPLVYFGGGYRSLGQ
ncbi:MAG: flavin reductase family protein [Candidatus Latescibacteria bacterium]|jgi:flavin reductase (DIM6/NTAB) family NADH-FMN oxidoreductase RutF|nr:flavin reductase family protein [Candidatus Latescibacterota bacterium]MBT5831200.1 flavin reductase family protein [Candidatus Latescibacterota bacterium]